MNVYEIVELLRSKDLTLSTAESCTGGLLSGRIVDVPGASWVFPQGFVTYSNEAKAVTLGVNRKTLDEKGAVSAECACEMAEGAARVSGSDIGLSTTGIAGPDGGSDEKPVGLVYIGIFSRGRSRALECHFKGGRSAVRSQTVEMALDMLEKELKTL